MSKLLINEPYIPVSVALMLKIKPSRAIVLQKLYSLTIIKNNYLADFQDWNGLIPYLSDDQLKNILIWLEGNNLIISKSEKGKRGKWYSINLKGITEFGLEVIEDYIFPMSRKNKKKSFILPSLVKLVGIPSAIIIQDFYFNNGIAFYQMKHKKIINEFIYFKSRRQIEIIFQDLQNRDIFKSELRDDSNKNEGKFYAVNKRNIYALLGVCFTEYVENEQNEARSEPVDKSLIVDNFNNQNRISAGLKPNFSGTKTEFQRDYSIDQDQERSLKKTILIPWGADKGCGIIPTMKDNIVSLKERLMTFKINSIESDDLLTKFSISRIEEVLDAAFKKEKKDGKQIFRGWIIKALQLGWNLKEKSKEVKVIIHTKPEDSLYRRELEVKTKIAKEKIDSVKRSAEDVEKHYMDMIRGMLRVSSSKPESNREFAKRIAPNVLEIYSRSEA